MGNINIKPTDSNLDSIEQLPDRSDLTALYYKPVGNYYAGGKEKVKEKLSDAEFQKMASRTATEIGMLISIPFILILLFTAFEFQLFEAEVSFATLYSLPELYIFGIILVYNVYSSYSKSYAKLEKIGINPIPKLFFQTFSLLALSSPLIVIGMSMAPKAGPICSILFSGALFCISIIISKISIQSYIKAHSNLARLIRLIILAIALVAAQFLIGLS